MDLREIGWDGVDLILLAEDRDQMQALVNMVMKVQFPQKVRNFLTSCVTISFSRTLVPRLVGSSLLSMGVKHGLSHKVKNLECRCLGLEKTAQ
jgi:hypothetical protein